MRRPNRARRPRGGRRACLHRRGRIWTRQLSAHPRSGRSKLPLAEVLAARRGARQEHETTTRHDPRPGRFDGREPLTRGPPIAARARRRVLRHFGRRNFAAEHWTRRAAGGVLCPADPVCGTRRRWRLLRERGPRQLACRVDSADAHPRLCAAGGSRVRGSHLSMRILVCALPVSGAVRFCPRREEVGFFGRPGRERGESVRRANRCRSQRAGKWRSHAGPARPAASTAATNAGGGGAAGAHGTSAPSVSTRRG